MAKPKKLRLSWSLVKSRIDTSDIDQVIEPPDGEKLWGFKIPALDTKSDSLFIRPSVPRPPKWLKYVTGHMDTDDLPPVLGAASSGLLLVHVGDRLMAVSFGRGYLLLRPEALVQDFGLKVVLNSLDPSQIKSVDARTFDELSIYTRRGVSRDSALPAFELDTARDLLRGITGKASVEDLGVLSGTARLAINTAVQIPELKNMGEKLLKFYRSTRYRKDFKFIDNMRAENDPSIVAKLDQKLVTALKAKDLTQMHLAIPEAVNWQEIDGVRFSYRRKRHSPTPDPRISVYRQIRDADSLSLKRLGSDKVEAMSAVDGDQVLDHWRVYDCIVFETEYKGQLYVLSGGDWYRVSKTYRGQVEDFVKELPELSIGLPEAEASDDEPTYNVKAAQAIGAAVIDKDVIGVGGYDKVELCDILTKDSVFVHVKKRGRSSTLSHLFAQGVTSALLLLNEEKFRVDARKIASAHGTAFGRAVPKKAGAREKIKVAYVVLSRSKRKDTPYGLPFFSLVSLKNAAGRLSDAGVDVFVQEVKEKE